MKIDNEIGPLKVLVAGSDLKYFQEYLDYLKQVNKSPATLESYRRDITLFLLWKEFIFKKGLERANPQCISQFLDYLKAPSTLKEQRRKSFINPLVQRILFWTYKKDSLLWDRLSERNGLSVSSRRRYQSSLKNFYEFLCEKYPKKHFFHHGFKKNPVLPKIHAIKLKDSDIEHTPLLTEAQWSRISEVPMKPRDRLLLSLMYIGGLRLSEARTLRVSGFNLRTNVLNIIRKGGKRHQLFIQDQGHLGALWSKVSSNLRGEDPYLFPKAKLIGMSSPIGRRTAFKRVKKIFEKAGLPQNISPHSLRKACATRLYYETKDLLFVRDYLGHSDAKVTQTYIETQGQYLLNEVNNNHSGLNKFVSLNYKPESQNQGPNAFH